MKTLKDLFTPNARVGSRAMTIMVLIQLAIVFVWWSFAAPTIIPTPIRIGKALLYLLRERDLLGELLTTTWLCLKAMFYATILGLILSYSVVLPFFRPMVLYVVSQARFLTLVGFSFIIMYYTHSSSAYKVTLLIFGILPYLVTAMSNEVLGIKDQMYNYAQTLGLNSWQSVWHITIRGMLYKAFEVVKQNFAIAWMMITMVESANRENGGVGAMLVDQNRFGKTFDGVFAIQFGAIFLMGILIHVSIGYLSKKFFPYAYMKNGTK